MVVLDDHFLRSRAARRDPLRPGESDERRSFSGRDHHVESTAREVERAWDATHSAVALSSAAPASRTGSRESSEQLAGVKFGMRLQIEEPEVH